jgi:hypothetical protein
MTIHINARTIGIPDYIYQGIEQLGLEAEFAGDWRLSLKTGGASNDFWQLRIESPTGEVRQSDLDPSHQQRDALTVRTVLREMRETFGKT